MIRGECTHRKLIDKSLADYLSIWRCNFKLNFTDEVLARIKPPP